MAMEKFLNEAMRKPERLSGGRPSERIRARSAWAAGAVA
jgi:hypothetical protein